MKMPHKPPKIPRCLCSSYINYLLQIPSPSLFAKYRFFSELHFDYKQREANKYFSDCEQYEFNCLQWRIDNRIATREDYKKYLQIKKKPLAEKHRKQSFDNCIEQLNLYLQKLKEVLL